MPEDGIANIIEMRNLRVVEQERVLQFARIADHAIVAHDDVVADVGVVTDFAISTNDRRAFDHRAILHHGAFADENIVTDKRDAFALIAQRRLQSGLDVVLQLLQGVPGIFAAIEERGMLGLLQVKQIGWFEHAHSVSEPDQESTRKAQ